MLTEWRSCKMITTITLPNNISLNVTLCRQYYCHKNIEIAETQKLVVIGDAASIILSDVSQAHHWP